MPDTRNNRGLQTGEPSKCLNGWVYGERLAKEAFSLPATIGSKKNSDRALIPGVEAVQVPVHLALPGSPQAKQLCHHHAQISLGQSCHRAKDSSVLALSFISGVSDSFLPWRLWQDSLSGRGFSMQECWSVLANTIAMPF